MIPEELLRRLPKGPSGYIFAILAGPLYICIIIILIIPFAAAGEWLLPRIKDAYFFNKLMYSLEYGFPYDAVTIDNKSRYDCDYNTAPLGEKHCHYDLKIVSSYNGRKNGHNYLCSYDLGKTWISDCWGDSPSGLLLRWERVDD